MDVILGKEVPIEDENEILSTFLNENGELKGIRLGETTVDNYVSINTLTSGQYGIIP